LHAAQVGLVRWTLSNRSPPGQRDAAAKQLGEPSAHTTMYVVRRSQPATPIVYSARSWPPHKTGCRTLLERMDVVTCGQFSSNCPRRAATPLAVAWSLASISAGVWHPVTASAAASANVRHACNMIDLLV
jgi:hypothetical protein